MSFYVNLTSESSVYTTNRASYFRCDIIPAVRLEAGTWTVALTEMFLPTHFNVESNSFELSDRAGLTVKKSIPVGYYPTNDLLIDAIAKTDARLTVKNLNKRGTVSLKIPEGFEMKFYGSLADLLGIESGTTITSKIDINTGECENVYKPMYVRINIISPQIFGTTRLPVLRMIYKQFGNIEFSPEYRVVNVSNLDQIVIEITTTSGEIVQFAKRPVHCTLHFLRVN